LKSVKKTVLLKICYQFVKSISKIKYTKEITFQNKQVVIVENIYPVEIFYMELK